MHESIEQQLAKYRRPLNHELVVADVSWDPGDWRTLRPSSIKVKFEWRDINFDWFQDALRVMSDQAWAEWQHNFYMHIMAYRNDPKHRISLNTGRRMGRPGLLEKIERDFKREVYGEFPEQPRCDNTSLDMSSRCQNVATLMVIDRDTREDTGTYACDDCARSHSRLRYRRLKNDDR